LMDGVAYARMDFEVWAAAMPIPFVGAADTPSRAPRG
jgi:hypothetical protein